MAPTSLFARPCVVILAVAVAVSRLMSTNGRAVRLPQHQQPQFQRHHSSGLEDSSYSDPELDIDRLYELMNDNRAADRIQQHPHQQLLKARSPSPPAAAAAAPAIGSPNAAAAADSSHVTAAAGPAALSLHQTASATVDSQQQHQQKPVNQSTAVHAVEPRYHFEVHSVQHTGQPFQTAEQKLRTVVRQAAAVEYHLKDVGDGRQTLIDDNEIHQKRLASIGRTRVQTDSGEKSSQKPLSEKAVAAAAAAAAEEARYRIVQEQLRQLQEQEQRYYDEGELDDEEMQEPYEPEADVAVPRDQSLKLDDAEIDKRQKQQTGDSKTKAAATADGGDRRLPSAPKEREVDTASSDDIEESQPLALPVKTEISDRLSVHGSAGSASSIADIYFLAVVIGCAVAGIAGFMFAGLCWYRLHRKMKEAGDVDYPAYGVTGPVALTGGSGGVVAMPGGTAAGSPGDRKLAQSAQMYHYQHQKQQMIASERLSSDVNQQVGGAGSDVESEEENEDGDYTVFECPGLATNGEMEVRNPMFNDPTPVSTPADTANLYGQTKK